MEEGGTEPGPPAAGSPPRTSGLLVMSFAVSGLTLLLPTAMGPVGPFVAGVLAFLGHRRVRASGGELRGPRVAAVAMTLALVLLGLQAWNVVNTASTARAWGEMRRRIAEVDGTLRTGTAEGAWELLAPEARERLDRESFLESLSGAMQRLGPLETLGTAEEEGGDWERTAEFPRGDRAELRLPLRIPSRFRGGAGVVRIEVLVRREGPRVSSGITALSLTPGED